MRRYEQGTEFRERTLEKKTPKKDMVRQETVDYVLQYFSKRKAESISFLNLPCSEWVFERSLTEGIQRRPELGISRLNFTGCERHKKTYDKAVVAMTGLNPYDLVSLSHQDDLGGSEVRFVNNYALYYCDIFDYMARMRDRKFDCVWLDTMTNIAEVEDKLDLLQYVTNDSAIAVLTFSKGRERISIPPDRAMYMKAIMHRAGFTLLRVYEYKDSSAMMHFICVKTTKTDRRMRQINFFEMKERVRKNQLKSPSLGHNHFETISLLSR